MCWLRSQPARYRGKGFTQNWRTNIGQDHGGWFVWYTQDSVTPYTEMTSIRKITVSAADIKALHVRPVELRHAFEDEFAHFV